MMSDSIPQSLSMSKCQWELEEHCLFDLQTISPCILLLSSVIWLGWLSVLGIMLGDQWNRVHHAVIRNNNYGQRWVRWKIAVPICSFNQHEMQVGKVVQRRIFWVVSLFTRWISTGNSGTWFAIWISSPSVRSRLIFFSPDRHWRTSSVELLGTLCFIYFMTFPRKCGQC